MKLSINECFSSILLNLYREFGGGGVEVDVEYFFGICYIWVL